MNTPKFGYSPDQKEASVSVDGIVAAFDDGNGNVIPVTPLTPLPVTGGGAGGGGSDRELVVTTYVASAAFDGAEVGDTITYTQIVDVSVSPVTTATLWRNQSKATDFAVAPSAANLDLLGTKSLTLLQLLSAGLATSGNQDVANEIMASIESKAPQLVGGRVPVDTGLVQAVTVDQISAAGLALDGVDATGIAPLDGAVGVRGWLSSIFQRLYDGVGRTWNLDGLTDTVKIEGGNAAPVAVEGSVVIGNFPAIQPVTAEALPLPAGAATAENQAAALEEIAALKGLIGFYSVGYQLNTNGELVQESESNGVVTRSRTWSYSASVEGVVTATPSAWSIA